MSYSAQLLPLLLERVGVRRIKSGTCLFPLIQPSPSGEGFKTCVDTYALHDAIWLNDVKINAQMYTLMSYHYHPKR